MTTHEGDVYAAQGLPISLGALVKNAAGDDIKTSGRDHVLITLDIVSVDVNVVVWLEGFVNDKWVTLQVITVTEDGYYILEYHYCKLLFKVRPFWKSAQGGTPSIPSADAMVA